MNGIRRQHLLLGLLVLLIAYGGARSCGGQTDAPATVGAESASSRRLTRTGSARPVRAQARPEPLVVALNVEQLEKKPGTFQAGRDPFRFAPKQAPPRRQPPKPRRQPRRQPERVAEAQPTAPRPPEIDFVYLGSFGTKQRRIAVFSDGEEITNALTGDLLKGQFVVAKIGFESVDIKFKDFPDAPPRRLSVGG